MRGPVPWLAAPLLLHSTLRPRVGAPPFCQAPPPPKPRLMLVEDQDGLRSAVCKYLQQRGYVVEAFGRVDAAFDAITKGLFPDLIVTDVTMPGLDGYQLLKRVRADPRLCGVPVILLTARGLSGDRIAGYSAGPATASEDSMMTIVDGAASNMGTGHVLDAFPVTHGEVGRVPAFFGNTNMKEDNPGLSRTRSARHTRSQPRVPKRQRFFIPSISHTNANSPGAVQDKKRANDTRGQRAPNGNMRSRKENAAATRAWQARTVSPELALEDSPQPEVGCARLPAKRERAPHTE